MLRFPTTFAWRATQQRSSPVACCSWIGGGQRSAVPDPESPALHSWPTECSRAEPARVCNGVCNRRGHNLTRPGTSSASRFKSGGQADGFGRRGSGDAPASRLGIGADGVDPLNAVHQGEVVENRESVERSAEVATARWWAGLGSSPHRRAPRVPLRIRPTESARLARARGVRPTGFESALPAPRTLFATEFVAKSVRTVLRRLGRPATNAPLGQKPGGAVVSGGCVSGGAWQACGGCSRRVGERSKAHDPELGRGLLREGRFCSQRLRARAAFRTSERGVRGKADAGRHSGQQVWRAMARPSRTRSRGVNSRGSAVARPTPPPAPSAAAPCRSARSCPAGSPPGSRARAGAGPSGA